MIDSEQPSYRLSLNREFCEQIMTSVCKTSAHQQKLIERYHACGLHTTLDQHGNLILRAGSIGAVRTPADLGHTLYAELRRRGALTPIIVSRRETLIFLGITVPDRNTVPLFDPLFAFGARRTVTGSTIVLPGIDQGKRRWLVEPFNQPLLALNCIVDTVLDIGGNREGE